MGLLNCEFGRERILSVSEFSPETRSWSQRGNGVEGTEQKKGKKGGKRRLRPSIYTCLHYTRLLFLVNPEQIEGGLETLALLNHDLFKSKRSREACVHLSSIASWKVGVCERVKRYSRERQKLGLRKVHLPSIVNQQFFMKMKMIRVSDTLNILKKLGKIEEKIDSKFYYSLDSFRVKREVSVQGNNFPLPLSFPLTMFLFDY